MILCYSILMSGKEVLDEIIESVEHEIEEVEHWFIRFFKKFF